MPIVFVVVVETVLSSRKMCVHTSAWSTGTTVSPPHAIVDKFVFHSLFTEIQRLLLQSVSFVSSKVALGICFYPTVHSSIAASALCQLGQLAPLQAILMPCGDINWEAFFVRAYLAWPSSYTAWSVVKGLKTSLREEHCRPFSSCVHTPFFFW